MIEQLVANRHGPRDTGSRQQVPSCVGCRCALELTAHPDTVKVAVHDPSRHVPRVRTPDLNGGTGGLGRSMVTGLAHATAVTSRASGGKSVSACLAR
ncbi:hypothetical protein ACWDFL_08115 [Streptomyces bungoensis]